MTQLDVPNRQTTPTQHTRVLGSSFRCLDKEGKRPQKYRREGTLYTALTHARHAQASSTRAHASARTHAHTHALRMNTRTQHARTYICHMPVYYYAYVYLKVARVPVVRKPSCAETCLRTRTRNTLHLCESDWLDAFVSECCSTLALRSFGKGSSASRALSSHVKIGRPATRLYFCS